MLQFTESKNLLFNLAKLSVTNRYIYVHNNVELSFAVREPVSIENLMINFIIYK